MPSYRAKAIILKSYKLGESDKIIKMYSQKDGIISAVAKGSRKIKSKFGGRLELFNFVDLELATGRNLDIITQAEIIKSFKNIPLDFNKFVLCELISEIILKTQSTGIEVSHLLFKLIYVCFSEIDGLAAGDAGAIKKAACFFGAKFLKIIGLNPITSSCSKCGSDIDVFNSFLSLQKNILFSIKNGGIICQQCITNPGENLEVRILTIEGYKFLDDLFHKKLKDFRSIEVSPESINKIYKLIRDYIEYHTECSIDSFNYLNKIVV